MKKYVFSLVACVGMLCSTAYAAGVELDKSEWTLQSLSGWKGQSPAKLPTPATLAFNGGKVSGNDSCNNFNGMYSVIAKSHSLRIPTDKMASTKMACAAPADKFASLYGQTLNKVTTYTLQGNTLTLKGAKGSTLATFTKPASTLPGTSWQVMSYNNGKEALVSSANTGHMTATFTKDGRVQGNAGCNTYTGTYKNTSSNAAITISQIAASTRLCLQPEDVMEEERLFLKALASAKTFHRSGASLTLLNQKSVPVLELSLKTGK